MLFIKIIFTFVLINIFVHLTTMNFIPIHAILMLVMIYVYFYFITYTMYGESEIVK